MLFPARSHPITTSALRSRSIRAWSRCGFSSNVSSGGLRYPAITLAMSRRTLPQSEESIAQNCFASYMARATKASASASPRYTLGGNSSRLAGTGFASATATAATTIFAIFLSFREHRQDAIFAKYASKRSNESCWTEKKRALGASGATQDDARNKPMHSRACRRPGSTEPGTHDVTAVCTALDGDTFVQHTELVVMKAGPSQPSPTRP